MSTMDDLDGFGQFPLAADLGILIAQTAQTGEHTKCRLYARKAHAFQLAIDLSIGWLYSEPGILGTPPLHYMVACYTQHDSTQSLEWLMQ